MKLLSGRSLGWSVLASLAFLLFAANAGKMLVVNAPEPSDVIIVLAGETDRRPARALELLRQGYGHRLLIDVPAAGKIYNLTQVQLAKEYVQGLPEASAIGICPIAGQSTRDESRDVVKCFEEKDGKRILLVTSDFHTRRSLSTFRHEIPRKIFSVAAAYDDAEFGARWWTRRQWAKTCLDEWMRLWWWNCVDRWR
jgi:DUF218 domain-containing protein